MLRTRWSCLNPATRAPRLLTIAALAMLAQTPAQAQQTGGEAEGEAAAQKPEALEHVLVIGEKIERSYLQTFSSVGIVTAEQLENFDIADTSDAYKRLANVRAFTQGAGSNTISIRGLEADGITEPTNSAALISVIVDGVTQSNEGLKRGSRGLWDVERLEVHRGPQGTIQGRNALAGTVVIRTRNPTFEPEYRFRGLYGELDREEVAGAVSGPILADELAYRLSGEYAEKTRDIDFDDPGNEFFADDEYHNLRGKLLYRPKNLSSLEVLLTVNDVFDAPSVPWVSGPDFFDREFEGQSNFAEKREMDLQNYIAEVSWDMGSGMFLRSVSGYNDTDLEITSAPSSEVFFRDGHREDGDFQQELRLEMNEEIGGITGVAGLFYASFEQDVEDQTEYYFFVDGDRMLSYQQTGTANNETETWAAYADLRYRFSDSLSLIFGGRYQDDTVNNKVNFNYLSGPVRIDARTGHEVFLPKLGLALDLTANQTLAVTGSRGYRQGLVESREGAETFADVDPEYVWAYEIAYRLSALDNRLVLGANVFYNDYEDQQVAVRDADRPAAFNTLNVGNSEFWGAEIEFQYAFGNGFSAYGALGLLETELGDFPAEGCDGGSCEGNQYSEAPEVTASVGGEFVHSSGFFATLSTSYTDEFFTGSINNSEELKVEDSFVVNAKTGYRFERFTVSAYVNNLFDENYLTGRVSENEAVVGDGRALGVEIQADF